MHRLSRRWILREVIMDTAKLLAMIEELSARVYALEKKIAAMTAEAAI